MTKPEMTEPGNDETGDDGTGKCPNQGMIETGDEEMEQEIEQETEQEIEEETEQETEQEIEQETEQETEQEIKAWDRIQKPKTAEYRVEHRYQIGDVAGKLGISRDTLRFYEKKGVIHPQKRENGYRYYSYKDVRILMDILFFRKYGFSLEEIYELLHVCTYESFMERMERKLEEEKKLLERKKRSIENLLCNKEIISRGERCLGVYEVRPFPDFRLLKEDLLISAPQVMELCYIYDEYRVSQQEVEMRGQYMLVPGQGAKGLLMDLPQRLDRKQDASPCVYTVVESDSYSPSPSQLQDVMHWATSRGLRPEGNAYAGYLVRCIKNGKQVYYIEIYLPLEETKEEERK